ncbi:MAG TPA: hypothetical protein VL048_13040 [Xanthobacteraceae bacterium]|jgi:ElaB/YqjD/DUF883 family membrane-anchored ribosome-binding protein|nr:hypothetical protein [Xanthobacteraceae bacterium]
MSSASTVSSNLRESASDAREAARDIGNAAADASPDIQRDLQALRDDFARLAEQVGDIVANRGNAAWQRARSSVDGVVSDAQERSREAVDAMREVSDNFVEAIDESIKTRPYATLAIVAGLGFLFGATWRR